MEEVGSSEVGSSGKVVRVLLAVGAGVVLPSQVLGRALQVGLTGRVAVRCQRRVGLTTGRVADGGREGGREGRREVGWQHDASVASFSLQVK